MTVIPVDRPLPEEPATLTELPVPEEPVLTLPETPLPEGLMPTPAPEGVLVSVTPAVPSTVLTVLLTAPVTAEGAVVAVLWSCPTVLFAGPSTVLTALFAAPVTAVGAVVAVL